MHGAARFVQTSAQGDKEASSIGAEDGPVFAAEHVDEERVEPVPAVPLQPVNVVDDRVAACLSRDVLDYAVQLLATDTPVPAVCPFHVREYLNPSGVVDRFAAVHLALCEGVIPKVEGRIVTEHRDEVAHRVRNVASFALALRRPTYEVGKARSRGRFVGVPIGARARCAVVPGPPVGLAGEEARPDAIPAEGTNDLQAFTEA